MAIMVALIAVLLLAVLALTYRLWKLRQGGTAAILRDIPAVGGHGWRHGVIRYRGGEAGFYRLSSLRLWPDRRLSRRGIEIVSRRAPRGDEFDIMTAEIGDPRVARCGRPAPPRLRDCARSRSADGVPLLARIKAVPPGSAAHDVNLLRRLASGLPQHVSIWVGHPRQNEQQVRQPVEVLGGQRAHVSACASSAAQADRSARRVTVRATCSSAESGEPPGRTKEFSAGSGSLYSSHQPSSRSI